MIFSFLYVFSQVDLLYLRIQEQACIHKNAYGSLYVCVFSVEVKYCTKNLFFEVANKQKEKTRVFPM
jgi:hypothetical protein